MVPSDLLARNKGPLSLFPTLKVYETYSSVNGKVDKIKKLIKSFLRLSLSYKHYMLSWLKIHFTFLCFECYQRRLKGESSSHDLRLSLNWSLNNSLLSTRLRPFLIGILFLCHF